MEQKQELDYQDYLEKMLGQLRSRKLITAYKLSKDKDQYFRIDISGLGFQLKLYADFQKTMEIVINNYYRNITDYLIGDYKDTIDWYLEIIQNLAEKKYTVIKYLRNEKLVCKYLKMEVRGRQLNIGDLKNHFKLFSNQIQSTGDEL